MQELLCFCWAFCRPDDPDLYLFLAGSHEADIPESSESSYWFWLSERESRVSAYFKTLIFNVSDFHIVCPWSSRLRTFCVLWGQCHGWFFKGVALYPYQWLFKLHTKQKEDWRMVNYSTKLMVTEGLLIFLSECGFEILALSLRWHNHNITA